MGLMNALAGGMGGFADGFVETHFALQKQQLLRDTLLQREKSDQEHIKLMQQELKGREAARQLQTLSSDTRARIYLDLPLGVNSNGYDVWRERDLFATGVAAGAPPMRQPYYARARPVPRRRPRGR